METRKQEIGLVDIAPKTWFPKNEGNNLWVAGYRCLLVDPTELQRGIKTIDFDRVRAVMLWGHLKYFSAPNKWHIDSDGHIHYEVDEIKESSTEEGSYIVFLTPYAVSGTAEPESVVRERVDVAAGLLAAIANRNIVAEKIYENILDTTSLQSTFYGPVLENPNWSGPVDIGKHGIDRLNAAASNASSLPDKTRNRVGLSLRWYEMSIRDSGVNEFIKLWLAIETLAMPDTTDIKMLIGILSKGYSVSYDEAKTRYCIGEIFGLRALVVHQGKIVGIDGHLIKFMRAIFSDLLSHQLNISWPGCAEAVLLETRFDLRGYLRNLFQQ